jgi:glycosyltransferase involved in cell wall biosynthesis
MAVAGRLTALTALRVLRAEGPAALKDRISDRLRENRRRRSFQSSVPPLGLPAIPVLNLLTTAPTPRLGGLQAQLLNRIDIEAERRPLALLYPEADGYRLEVAAAGRRLALAIGAGSQPSPVALSDIAFESAVARAASLVGARALHVEGLASVPLESLLALERSGLRLLLSVHDFSLFCPRPHLLESPAMRFCGYSRDEARCAACLAQSWHLPPGFQGSRRALARELLEAADAVVYPSDFLRRRHLELFPGLPADAHRVIEPPGQGGEAPADADGPVRHVAYIGSVHPHKGALVFDDVVRGLPPDRWPELRWSAYGGGDPELLLRLRRLPRVKVRGYYRAGSLVDLLRQDRVDLALLLSIVPESYGLALSECLEAGVPVVAFDHGAMADRLRLHGGGLLVDPELGAAGVAGLIAELANGRRVPRQGLPFASPPEAVAEAFQKLYHELGLDFGTVTADIMRDVPFTYPAQPRDRALSAAGKVERLARGALRHLSTGRLDEVPAALRRLRITPPGPDAPETPETVAKRQAAAGAPVLYLPAVAWSYRFQRPQHLALALTRAGHPVLYVEGFLRSRLLPSRSLVHRQGDLHVLRVRVPGRPDPYRQPLDAAAASRLASTIVAGLGRRRPLMVLVQLPFWAELGRELSRRLGVPLVYDRIDLHTGFPGVPREIEAVEAGLLRDADLVCATASQLAEAPAELDSRVLLLPNAVDLAAFPRTATDRDLRRGARRPVRIGYVGALGPWFDVAAVREAARRHPDWQFRLAGQVEAPEVAALAGLPNLEMPGEIPFREVPCFLADLDVALVPFRDLPLTRAVDPVKLYEALAMGLPVVARRLPETERWAEPHVYLYDSPADLVRQLRRAISEQTPALARERRALAEGESWDHRVEELLGALRGLRRMAGSG